MTDRDEDRAASDDERLSALIDGELDAAETVALEARLAAEPALARRLAALREADSTLRRAYGDVANEPLPARLVGLVEGHALPGGDGRDDTTSERRSVVPLRPRIRTREFWVPGSIAAGIALAIGIWFGTSVGPRDALTATERLLASGAPIGPDSELYAVIESMPSGETATLAGNISATPRLTFRTADGGFCREVGLSAGSRQTAIVGCRENGGWIPEAVIHVPGTPDADVNDGFVPASGPAAALDSIIDGLMSGVPLGAAAESEAIATGWR